MRKLIVNEWMSLDGVVQAPGASSVMTAFSGRSGSWTARSRPRARSW
jgi:hypothetical protein